jgi:exo-beta-1,3-glucanase (GH17 family)
MTLLKPGKMLEQVEEIAKTQIEILALQEVGWPGKGHINKKDYLI